MRGDDEGRRAQATRPRAAAREAVEAPGPSSTRALRAAVYRRTEALDHAVADAPPSLLEALRPPEPSRSAASRAAVLGALDAGERALVPADRHAALRTVAEGLQMMDAADRDALLEGLGALGGARLARALGFDGRALAEIDHGRAPPAPDAQGEATRALLGQIARRPTAGGAGFVAELLVHLCPRALFLAGGELGRALAALAHPADPARARAEGERLAEVLGEARLWWRVAGPDLHPSVRRETLAQIARDPGATRAALLAAPTHPWLDAPAQRAALLPRAEDLLRLRGDAPSRLGGSDLENTIGAALGLRPSVPRGEPAGTREAREADVAAGRRSYFDEPPAAAQVGPIAARLRALGGPAPAVTVLPLRFATLEAGAANLVLFRVQDARTGLDRFVDHEGRAYAGFAAWRAENTLPPGRLSYPVGGHLEVDAHGVVALEAEVSHAAVDTPGELVWAALDGAALVGGAAGGVAAMAGTGGAAAWLGIGASTWWGARSLMRLQDRVGHGTPANPLEDAGARAEWLGFGASLVGLGLTAAGGFAARLGAPGGGAGLLARVGYATLAVAESALDAASAAHAAEALLRRWDDLDGGTRAELALTVGFWGARSGAALFGNTARPFDLARRLATGGDGLDVLPRAGLPRDTVGWSGRPSPEAPPGAEHLPVIHRGLARLEAARPGVVGRLRALVEPDPRWAAEVGALAARRDAALAEHRALGASAPAARGGLVRELDRLDAELGRAEARLWAEREARPHRRRVKAQLGAELAPVLAALRTRVGADEARALAARVRIDPSVRQAGVGEPELRRWLADYFAIVGTRLPPERLRCVYQASAHGGIPRDRAYYDHASGTLNLGSHPTKHVLFHELTHLYEHLHPEVQRAARTWREARATAAGHGARAYPLAELEPGAYGPEELAQRDHWRSPYVGKLYPEGGTEVLAMGAEALADPRRMADLFLADPEHLMLVLGAF